MLHIIQCVGHVARGDTTKGWATHVENCWTGELDNITWHMRPRIGVRAAHCMQVEADIDLPATTWMATHGYTQAQYRGQWEAFARQSVS